MATKLGCTNEAIRTLIRILGQSNVQSKLASNKSPSNPPPASSNPLYRFVRPISSDTLSAKKRSRAINIFWSVIHGFHL